MKGFDREVQPKERYLVYETDGRWQVISGRRYTVRPHLPLDPEKCGLLMKLLQGASSSRGNRRMRRKFATLALAMALGLVAPSFVKPARAATYTAGCSAGTGDVAGLISAIRSANANPGPDVIVLGTKCIYNLRAVDNWWYGPNGLPPIASEITIEGEGSTIQRNTTAQPDRLRFFYVGADPVNNLLTLNFTTLGAGKLTLHNLILKNGRQMGGEGGGGGAGMGGAIFNQGELILDSVILTGNSAAGGKGMNVQSSWGGGGMGGHSGFGGYVSPAGSSGHLNGGAFGKSGTASCDYYTFKGGGGGGFGISDNAAGLNGGGTANGLGGATGYGSGRGGNGSGSGSNFVSNYGKCGSGGGGVGGGGGEGGTYRANGGGGGGFGGGGGTPEGAGGFGGGGGALNGASGFGGGIGDGYAYCDEWCESEGTGGGGGGLGGAIFNHNGNVFIGNSTLSGNSASGGDSIPDPQSPGYGFGGSGYGAALFNLNGTVTIVKSTITGNTVVAGTGADGNGQSDGAVYNLGYEGNLSPHASVVISGTVISGTIGGQNTVSSSPAQVSGGLTNKATAVISVSPSPEAPSGLAAKAVSSTAVVVSWKDNSLVEDGFSIERKKGTCKSTELWTQIATVGKDIGAYRNNSLTASTDYAYRVRAYNADGKSAYSNCAVTTTGPAGSPEAPIHLKAVATSPDKINLTWADNSGNETGFVIYRRVDESTTWSRIKATGAHVTGFTDTTAFGNNARHTYAYYVQACNGAGCSPATTFAAVPHGPGNLTASASGGSIDLNWTVNSIEEKGFQIYRKTGACGTSGIWTQLATAGPGAAAFSDGSAVPGITYSYKVRAYAESAAQPYATSSSQFSGCSDAMAYSSAFQHFLKYNGHTYATTKEPLTWSSAKKLAVSEGGHLVTVNDATESQFLIVNYWNNYGNPWIGLNDVATPGIWVWVDGETVTYTNWALGEPSGSTEHCVMTNWTAPGLWNNVPCSDSRLAIVEWQH